MRPFRRIFRLLGTLIENLIACFGFQSCKIQLGGIFLRTLVERQRFLWAQGAKSRITILKIVAHWRLVLSDAFSKRFLE